MGGAKGGPAFPSQPFLCAREEVGPWHGVAWLQPGYQASALSLHCPASPLPFSILPSSYKLQIRCNRVQKKLITAQAPLLYLGGEENMAECVCLK